jgi:hypothetical protein
VKNLINEQICSWLGKYTLQTSNKSIQKTAEELLSLIPSTLSLNELIDLFKSYTNKESNSGAIYFYSALLDWQKRLEQRLKDQEAAIARIQQIKYPPKMLPLFTMLKELLTEPLIILHVQAPQFLKFINNEHFEQVIVFLSKQKINHIPPSRTSPFIKNRIFAERLLAALTAESERDNLLLSHAYSFIEAILSFYIEDMHLVEM